MLQGVLLAHSSISAAELDGKLTEHLYDEFIALRKKASVDHNYLSPTIQFFNDNLAQFIRTKESWLQALSMIMVDTDMFRDA